MPGGHLRFDENTDSIDSYVLRMSQVVAMLNYGEMQILENFKNTLPYRLYSTLINVNNLKDAIDLGKRVLTKEKLDRQLTGQASTAFMKATSNNDSHSPQNYQKKGVTFDAMETLDRNSEADGTTTGQVIGVVITDITTDQVIRDRTIDKTHNGLLETEVKVEVEMKTMVMFILEVEVEIEIREEEKNPGLDLIQG